VTAIIATILILQCLLNGWLVYLVWKGGERSMTTAMLALTAQNESALNHVRSKSLDEKVANDAMKMQHDVQMSYLKDTLAKQEQLEREKAKALSVQKVKADDGREFNFNDLEIMS
jgi:hypothetical protein